MARTTIKATYSLDVETVRRLERMASRLGITKTEAVRRAIRAAAEEGPDERRQAVAVFDELRDSLGLTPDGAADWAKTVRHERRNASRRREAPSR